VVNRTLRLDKVSEVPREATRGCVHGTDWSGMIPAFYNAFILDLEGQGTYRDIQSRTYRVENSTTLIQTRPSLRPSHWCAHTRQSPDLIIRDALTTDHPRADSLP
jgi:hypothetical protein